MAGTASCRRSSGPQVERGRWRAAQVSSSTQIERASCRRRLHQPLDPQLGWSAVRRSAHGAHAPLVERDRLLERQAARLEPRDDAASSASAWSNGSAGRSSAGAVRRPATAVDGLARRSGRSCGRVSHALDARRPARPEPAGPRADRRRAASPRRARRCRRRRARWRSRARASRTGSSAARPRQLARQIRAWLARGGPASRRGRRSPQRPSAARSAAQPGVAWRAWRGRAAGPRARARRRARPPAGTPRGRAARHRALARVAPAIARRRPRPGARAGHRGAGRCSARVGHDELGRDRRRRRAHVGGELRERHVRLVAHADDDRARVRRDRAHDGLLVEGPQVLERAAAAGEDDDVDARGRSAGRSSAPTRRSAATMLSAAPAPWTWQALTTMRASGQRRARTLADVVEHGARQGGDDADRPRPGRQRPLARGVEQALRRRAAP